MDQAFIAMAVHHFVGHTCVVQCAAQLLVGGLLAWPFASGAGQVKAHQQSEVRRTRRCGLRRGCRFVLDCGGCRCAGQMGGIPANHLGPFGSQVLLQRQRQGRNARVGRSEQRNQRDFLHVNRDTMRVMKAIEAAQVGRVVSLCALRIFVL